MTGQNVTYKYYCETEGKFVYEEKLGSDPKPTQCINNSGHTFNANSLSILKNKYCKFKELTGVTSYNEGNFTTENITLLELARLVRGLIETAKNVGVLEYE